MIDDTAMMPMAAMRVEFIIRPDEMPVMEGRPPGGRPRYFHAFLFEIKPGAWAAQVEEVCLEERGDAESGPMGLDETWTSFGFLPLDVDGPLGATALARALERAMVLALYEEMVAG